MPLFRRLKFASVFDHNTSFFDACDRYCNTSVRRLNRSAVRQWLINFAMECNLVKLLQDCFMQPLIYTIDLWMTDFSFGMLDVIQRQIELVIVRFRSATVFCTALSEHSNQSHFLLGEERQYPVIQQLCCSD